VSLAASFTAFGGHLYAHQLCVEGTLVWPRLWCTDSVCFRCSVKIFFLTYLYDKVQRKNSPLTNLSVKRKICLLTPDFSQF